MKKKFWMYGKEDLNKEERILYEIAFLKGTITTFLAVGITFLLGSFFIFSFAFKFVSIVCFFDMLAISYFSKKEIDTLRSKK